MKKISLKKKKASFGDFSILTKIALSGPYRHGHFFGWFFQMVKILFEFFWNIRNFVLSWKHSVWSKNSMFCGLFHFDQNRRIQTLPVGPFVWLIFWNVENTFPILLKHSKLCSFIKTISFKLSFMKTICLKKKRQILGTFLFWPKSHYLDLTGMAILLVDFLVDFFKCWKYHSNSCETFKIVFFHQNNQFEALFHENNQFEEKKGKFGGLFNFDQNRCIWTLPAWPFFRLIFSNVENTFRILLKHSKFSSFMKTLSLKQKQHVLGTVQFWPKSL